MSSKGEDKRAKFLKIYANVPENLRRDIIVVINDKTYSWDSAYFEIKNNTTLGRKILKELEVMKVL